MKKETAFAWVLGFMLVALFAVEAVAIHRSSSGQQPITAARSTQPAPVVPVRKNPLLTDPKLMDVLTAAPGTASYAAIVAAQGVPTSVIHLTGCRPYPQVSLVALGQPVKIYNVDATARTLKGPAGSGFSLAVPAKGTTSFTFKGTTPGSFTYTCDGSPAGAVVTSK